MSIKSSTHLTNADIKWDAENQPFANNFADIYFSRTDPCKESHHVFVKGNNLEKRMANIQSRPFVIAECGFGFGLNFLTTCESFYRLAPTASRLHYISCELYPVTKKDLQKFYQQLPCSLTCIADLLLISYPEQGRGFHRLHFRLDSHQIILDLLYHEALSAFLELMMPRQGIDAWYLDGFAPAKNGAMWSKSLCRVIAGLSHEGTSLASYSVAGSVRRNLQEYGFKLTKAPGFAQKRHQLTGLMTQSPETSRSRLGWSKPFSNNIHKKDINNVAIIGAGLAGCGTAFALAKRGYKVTLFEKNDQIAAGASGNPQGIVHFKPSRLLDAGNRFHINAFNYAGRHYADLATNHDIQWQPCGLIQLAIGTTEQAFQKDLLERQLYDPALLLSADPAQVSKLAGMSIAHPGIHIPSAGFLNPVALCQAWTASKMIELQTSQEVKSYKHDGSRWHLSLSDHERCPANVYDAVILCNSMGSRHFPDLPEYPLITNYGQTDTFTLKKQSAFPQTIICHKGYLIPWQLQEEQLLTIGGSFARGNQQSSASTSLLNKNLLLLKQISPQLYENFSVEERGRVSNHMGTRTTTPDYRPVVGPVENIKSCRKIFSAYRRNARAKISDQADYLPNLYINVAHGSSGLTTIPLISEYLASLISEESLPLSGKEIPAIHPLRFLIRDLKRQK